MFSIYRTEAGYTIEKDSSCVLAGDFCLDKLFTSEDPLKYTEFQYGKGQSCDLPEGALLAPVSSQEVWAAGVTYYRSRDARMEPRRPDGGE